MKRPPVLALVALSSLVVGARAAEPEPLESVPETSSHAWSRSPDRPHTDMLADVDKALSDLEREEQRERERFDELGRRVELLGKRVLARGRAYVRRARAGLLPLGEGISAFTEHAAAIERLRRSIAADITLQRALVAERSKSAERLDELGRRAKPLRSERETLARAEAAFRAEEDRKRAFERAFLASSPPNNHTAIYGANASGPADPSALRDGFASMKGRLPFPISGRAEVRHARRGAGSRKSSSGPGVEFAAPLGTAVRAVYAGRVAFADTYPDYGNTVIIDHGDRYYTVMGNLGAIEVRVSDEISANARIGTLGDTGRGTFVYFELRVGASSVDPAPWFGL